jgi:LuxR family maltose regulon positive regulatory protein
MRKQDHFLAHRAERPAHTRNRLSPFPREQACVLSLLVAGQTYAEMALALIVSPNTSKTQVSSIYRKLGVSRRAQAIKAAARLRLLSSKSPDCPSGDYNEFPKEPENHPLQS